jgi:hypothetical protein
MRKALLIIFGAVVLIGVGLFFLHRWGLHTFGPGYDPNNSHDLQKLMAIADDSRPFRDALERFRHDHGSYPAAATNLFPKYLRSTNSPEDFSDWIGWRYIETTTNGYSLHYQVNWDDGLWYEHLASGTDRWHYSTSVSDTDLTQKFEHR